MAVEFLGPLTVAAVRSHNKQALLWPLLALLGVVLLTEPWQGTIDPAGVRFAAGSAVGWGPTSSSPNASVTASPGSRDSR